VYNNNYDEKVFEETKPIILYMHKKLQNSETIIHNVGTSTQRYCHIVIYHS